jgi:hypothetical protein
LERNNFCTYITSSLVSLSGSDDDDDDDVVLVLVVVELDEVDVVNEVGSVMAQTTIPGGGSFVNMSNSRFIRFLLMVVDIFFLID